MAAKTLDEVIYQLELIIRDTITNQSPQGYFAALYQKVTISVKNKMGTGYFDDDVRMEKLDVLFANRYLDAYRAYKNKDTVSQSWAETFNCTDGKDLTVIQHLLLGMNAHINFDLGLAAYEVGKGDILSLKGDFNKINDLLGDLLEEVQHSLTRIWPLLKRLLKFSGNLDDAFVNFSMQIARKGAWTFALELAHMQKAHTNAINIRDQKIAALSKMITDSKVFLSFIIKLIRWSEKGNVASKINHIRMKL